MCATMPRTLGCTFSSAGGSAAPASRHTSIYDNLRVGPAGQTQGPLPQPLSKASAAIPAEPAGRASFSCSLSHPCLCRVGRPAGGSSQTAAGRPGRAQPARSPVRRRPERRPGMGGKGWAVEDGLRKQLAAQASIPLCRHVLPAGHALLCSAVPFRLSRTMAGVSGVATAAAAPRPTAGSTKRSGAR